METPETNKRESYSSNRFLGTVKKPDVPILIYTVEEVESTALESVFDELFKRLLVKD